MDRVEKQKRVDQVLAALGLLQKKHVLVSGISNISSLIDSGSPTFCFQ
jgi:hypothetical protein